jgi:hypothetical protein
MYEPSLQLCEICMTPKCPVSTLEALPAAGAVLFLARKFERSELWFCATPISISLAGVPLMKN